VNKWQSDIDNLWHCSLRQVSSCVNGEAQCDNWHYMQQKTTTTVINYNKFGNKELRAVQPVTMTLEFSCMSRSMPWFSCPVVPRDTVLQSNYRMFCSVIKLWKWDHCTRPSLSLLTPMLPSFCPADIFISCIDIVFLHRYILTADYAQNNSYCWHDEVRFGL